MSFPYKFTCAIENEKISLAPPIEIMQPYNFCYIEILFEKASKGSLDRLAITLAGLKPLKDEDFFMKIFDKLTYFKGEYNDIFLCQHDSCLNERKFDSKICKMTSEEIHQLFFDFVQALVSEIQIDPDCINQLYEYAEQLGLQDPENAISQEETASSGASSSAIHICSPSSPPTLFKLNSTKQDPTSQDMMINATKP